MWNKIVGKGAYKKNKPPQILMILLLHGTVWFIKNIFCLIIFLSPRGKNKKINIKPVTAPVSYLVYSFQHYLINF